METLEGHDLACLNFAGFEEDAGATVAFRQALGQPDGKGGEGEGCGDSWIGEGLTQAGQQVSKSGAGVC